MKLFLSMLIACFYVSGVHAVAYTNEITPSGGEFEGMEKLQTISTLEKDIAILDTEIAKCEKSKKGWIAATVIGSAGVVATGVAAGVQGAKISKNKQALHDYDGEIEEKNKQLSNLKK